MNIPQYLKQVEVDISTNPKNFWKFIGNKRNSSHIASVMVSDRGVFLNHSDIVCAFANDFKSVYRVKSDFN